jgi:hypothetical protein
MAGELAKVTSVRPAGDHVLCTRFEGDAHEYRLDLTGLIARSKHFAPLQDDANVVARLEIVEGGLGVARPVQTKWDTSTFPPRRCGGLPKSSGL